MIMQSLIHLIYPPQCLACDALTESDFALCGACWRDTVFIGGLVCDACGTPLLGEDTGEKELCDDCISIARPWDRGRATLMYRDTGRRLVLSLKHGDRTDLARPAGRWMAQTARDLIREDTVIVPVPLHWSRLLRRKYNQAAELAFALGKVAGCAVLPDALIRHTRTRPLEGHSRDQRFTALQGTISPHRKRGAALQGKHVLIVDDVMTSGATFAATTEGCRSAGATQIDVLALARVAKDA